MDKKGIIILSGGLDSTTLLYYLKERGWALSALTFNYGQQHFKEIFYAKQTCEKLGISWQQILLHDIFKNFKSALLDGKIPDKDYSVDTQKATVVPNRNMIMLSIAIGLAETNKIKHVFYAAHKNDRAVYPDCRREFVNALCKASELGTYSKVRVEAPFNFFTKAEIVKTGKGLDVPFEHTWSCYKGMDKACGVCGTCRERLKAFEDNGLKDPIQYDVDANV